MKLRLLLAYPNMLKVGLSYLQNLPVPTEIMLDSGAFSAFTAGKTVKLDDYQSFLHDFRDAFPEAPYVTLDSIGDPAKTYSNWHELMWAGHNPMPVLTPGVTANEVLEYVGDGNKVCIGGLVKNPNALGHIRFCTKSGADIKDAHLLGYGNATSLVSLRPMSADSSGWLNAPKFGRCLVLENRRPRFFRREEIQSQDVQRLVRRAGFDPVDLYTAKGWDGYGSVAMRLTLQQYIVWSELLFKRCNVRYYNAVSARAEIDMFVDEFQVLQQSKEGGRA